jgi:hypothetical protein
MVDLPTSDGFCGIISGMYALEIRCMNLPAFSMALIP